MRDLRPAFFGGFAWYDGLSPQDDEPTAWWVAKGTDPNPWVDSLNAALAFAVDHGLVDHYRTKFGGISPPDLDHKRAKREGRTCATPIFEIANELLVARYLERVFRWRFTAHEPPGRKTHVGDWQFVTPRGRAVFVEVKTVREPEGATGVFSASFAPGLRAVVARAYAQLPLDDRGVLVVLVGGLKLHLPAQNPTLSDLFAALFGDYVITFQVLPYDPRSVRGGPSFRDMTVHRDKHRCIGCVAALSPGGTFSPSYGFYAIHNPYAHDAVKLAREDFGNALQFDVDETGRGRWAGDLHPDVWPRVSESAVRFRARLAALRVVRAIAFLRRRWRLFRTGK